VYFEEGGECWGRFPAGMPGRLLVADLSRARAGWLAEAEGKERDRRERSTVCDYEVATEDGPTYLDAHAWRHWYVTRIASTDGISPATLQALSRHADPRLTLNTYSHARRDRERHAVDQLPDLGGDSRK
jgi:integrase